MNQIIKIYAFIKTPIFLGVFAILMACENDLKQVQELSAKQDSATVSAVNIEMRYTTNGKNQVLMSAPTLNRYLTDPKNPYLEFPNGMLIYFYDSLGKVSSTMKADYSLYYEEKGLWEARYDVEVVNEKGEKLNTEYLIWERNKEQISSDQRVKITTTDGIIYGNGFVSNQNFSSWEVIEGSGIINLEDDE